MITPRQKALDELRKLKLRNGKIESHSCRPVRGLVVKPKKQVFSPLRVWEYGRKRK